MEAPGRAGELLREFKGGSYAFGEGALGSVGPAAASHGHRAFLVAGHSARKNGALAGVEKSLAASGVRTVGRAEGARPNAPFEDVFALREALSRCEFDSVVVVGGGSGIDAAKAALTLHALGGKLEDYFGMGLVGGKLAKAARGLPPLVAVQTASASAAHLTKYANVTDFSVGQKKLIIDQAVVPPRAAFDYSVTAHMSRDFTCDGAFDGLGHCLEVYFGATGKPEFGRIEEVALTGIRLIVSNLSAAVADPGGMAARKALGLGTDLGGYAIMIGGTSGAHLNSFSLVDILSHGRAVAILNPYYTVFFAPAIERQLRQLAEVYGQAGLAPAGAGKLSGRELGAAVAKAMIAHAAGVGFPTRLGDVPGFSNEHVRRALDAAKTPQLRSKLENMPVPLKPELVDEYMGSVLEAAASGNMAKVKSL
jgi:alcohol dehydrogenase